jgi:hypothetical protein
VKVTVVTDALPKTGFADRILPRMSKYLTDANGWNLSMSPDPACDFNYFVNYGVYHKVLGWRGTPTGAYFSHLDTGNKGKEQMWHEAAKAIDVCVITAKLYGQYCPPEKVYQAHPPVDVNKFTIAKGPRQKKPVVGVAGWVYGDGRKGEHLWEKFTRHPVAQKLILTATGRGWPGVKCTYHDWSNIEQFYQELDVLLCPSLFEGVPMPPLEALACGVKIVVPSGVGLIDELPELPGIYRYKCGDLESMADAVREAVDTGKVDREALRQVITDNYTVEHWAADHKRIIDTYFQVDDIGELPQWKGNGGVYVVAFGEPSRRCAVRCIQSVKTQMPGLPVALVAETPLNAGEDVFIQQPDSDIGGRKAKLRVDELAPAEWSYVLYLDADIEVVGDIAPLFQFLQDGWELVICKDNNKYGLVKEMVRNDNQDECLETWAVMGSQELIQYNGGMMAYRRNANTKRFFARWLTEWDRYGKRDQGALLRALYASPVRMFLLMNQWNATTRYAMPPGEIAIKHHNTQARRWNGLIQGRIDSKEAWAAVKKFDPKVKL